MNAFSKGLTGAFALLALWGLACAARAAPTPTVPGWKIERGADASVCVATGPSQGGTGIGLVAQGPLFLLIVQAPDFPKDKASYPVTLGFDGKAPVSAVALGDGGFMQINVGRGEPAKLISSSSQVTVTVEGRSHSYFLPNGGAALDALARCAGQPLLSETARPPVPIPGAGDWRLAVTMLGVQGRACQARVPGDQIDTIMLLNNDGDLLLIGGHSDWATWGGDVPLELAVDGAPPVKLTASTVNNLILTLVTDPYLLARLRNAHTLDWTIPTGHVRGDVTGLGAALDAMRACKAGR